MKSGEAEADSAQELKNDKDPSAIGPQHVRGNSWSGSFSEIDCRGDAAAVAAAKQQQGVSKPPTATRRRSLDQERKKQQGSSRTTSRTSVPPLYNIKSPTHKAHKRLASIDEKGGGGDNPDIVTHFRNLSDELSALSMGSSRDSGSSRSDHSLWSMSQQERMAKFEQEQQEQFAQTKENLEKKLLVTLAQGEKVMTEREKHEFISDYMVELERERESLLAQWKAEWEAERELLEQQQQRPSLFLSIQKAFLEPCLESLTSMMATAEVFVANLPLTIGAVGLSWVTMGTVWFKFMEETAAFCKPVHYYSPMCNFPEFPGCFECDTSHPKYKGALAFHYACSMVAGLCCLLFALKVLIAGQVVADELSNPTTSTPMGVVCIATVCVFAGRGLVGEVIVVITSWFHFVLAFWFIYMAIVRFALWPDPGWFPNTVGLTYGAVKTFLYFPNVGLFFLALSVVFFFSTFFVSVVRVALNEKIAAPIAWIGLSAPSITMYALTLIAQPKKDREALLESDELLLLKNHDWMAHYYLPLQHFMMLLSLVGLASAVSALVVRWKTFSKKPFSPAHVAFCFPTLSHTNAVQAYRGAVNAYSNFAPGSPFKVALFSYWVFFLVFGTLLNIGFTILYVQRLPRWTKLDTAGEEEPPAPKDTFVRDMLDNTDAHELLEQPFMNPAVLQANEAGALVRVRRGTEDFRIHGPYVRTRKISALGFDPTMDEEELRRERAELLDWVAKNAPRKRNRTMSNPLFLQASSLIRGGNRQAWAAGGLYGSLASSNDETIAARHKRSVTTTQLPSGV